MSQLSQQVGTPSCCTLGRAIDEVHSRRNDATGAVDLGLQDRQIPHPDSEIGVGEQQVVASGKGRATVVSRRQTDVASHWEIAEALFARKLLDLGFVRIVDHDDLNVAGRDSLQLSSLDQPIPVPV